MNFKSILNVFAVAVAVSSVSAQDTAKVAFVVNTYATVTATRDSRSPVSITVTANTEKTLAVPLAGTDAIRYTGGTQGRLNAPTVSGSRGNITLRLPAQSYQHAEISLHAVNGKRILRGKATATETATAISRRNVAAGVYLLSVKGLNGEAFTARLTHDGGNVNINAAFGSASVSPDRKLAKSAAEEAWNIKVSADGYKDSTYSLNLVSGDNNPKQTITLAPSAPQNTFIDGRDGKVYKWTTIGTQTWMAQNLNYDGAGVCYDNIDANCTKYGRLYSWIAAISVCPAGWHLPSYDEWDELVNFVGGASVAGQKLKSTTGWGEGLGTDNYGFTALPGGNYSISPYSDSSFGYAGTTGYWWTSTGHGSLINEAHFWSMSNESNSVNRTYWVKTNQYSVRCVAD